MTNWRKSLMKKWWQINKDKVIHKEYLTEQIQARRWPEREILRETVTHLKSETQPKSTASDFTNEANMKYRIWSACSVQLLAGAVKKLCRESWAEQGLEQRWRMGNGWKECGCLDLKKANFRYLKVFCGKGKEWFILYCGRGRSNGLFSSAESVQFRHQQTALTWDCRMGMGCLSLEVPENIPQAWCVFPWLGLDQMAIQESPGTTVQDSVTRSLVRMT